MKRALVEELVEDVKIQRTDCKQVGEGWMVCKKVNKCQTREEGQVKFVFE